MYSPCVLSFSSNSELKFEQSLARHWVVVNLFLLDQITYCCFLVHMLFIHTCCRVALSFAYYKCCLGYRPSCHLEKNFNNPLWSLFPVLQLHYFFIKKIEIKICIKICYTISVKIYVTTFQLKYINLHNAEYVCYISEMCKSAPNSFPNIGLSQMC